VKHGLITSIYSWNASHYPDYKGHPKGNIRKKNLLVNPTFVALYRAKYISEKLVFTAL